MLVEAVAGLMFLRSQSLREGMEVVGQAGILLPQQPQELQILVAVVVVVEHLAGRVRQVGLELLLSVIPIPIRQRHLQLDRQQ
jgi:hypothetical protein